MDGETWAGFRVDSPAGRVGYVLHLVPAAPSRPALLAVRAGAGGELVLFVPVEDVGWVDDVERVVALNNQPRVDATRRLEAA
jgi:hypothetical protein